MVMREIDKVSNFNDFSSNSKLGMVGKFIHGISHYFPGSFRCFLLKGEMCLVKKTGR